MKKLCHLFPVYPAVVLSGSVLLLGAIFLTDTTRAQPAPVTVPSLADEFAAQAEIAINLAAATAEYPAAHYFFLGRASAYNQAAEALRK